MAKHATPLLDQLESGPWPSFVSDIKQEAAARAANPKGLDYQIPADAPEDLLGVLELSYEEKETHWKHGGIVGVFGYGGGVIGRYCDQPEKFPGVAHFHTMRVAQPAAKYYNTKFLRDLCDIWDLRGSGITNMHGSTGDIVLLGTQTPQLEEIFHDLTHKLNVDLGGSGSNLRTPEACLGQSRCEYACYNTQDMCYQLTQDYQDELHRPAFPYKFKFKFDGCPNGCVCAMARSDFAVVGTWKDDIKIDQDAVKAYVTDDRKLATKTKKRTLSIDARCANLEAVCYNLIATQSPVASDFRLLQTIIYVDFNLQRMTDKVRQICRATRHMVKADISLPQELVGTVEAEAEAVYQVLGSSLSALVTNDMSIICNLAVEDEPVHAAYEKFFRTFNRMDTGDFMDDDSNYDDLRRAIMVSRYLDRIASISIDAACRLTFLLTGQRMTAGDIARTDEDELESMRVPSGEGVIMRPAVDAHFVAKVPANELNESLRYLLEHLEDEDDAEDDEE